MGSAAALMSRLKDGGNLLKMMRTEVIAELTAAAVKHPHQIDIMSGSFETETHKGLVTEAGSQGPFVPSVLLDLEIKGLDYDKLVISGEDLKKSFAKAVQDGIVSPGSSLDATSIALDISKSPDGVGSSKFTHVLAKFPLPEGIKPDATLSEYPGGRDAIMTSVQSNLRKIESIDSVARDSTGVQHQIVVHSSPLRLGALRATYDNVVTTTIQVYGLKHNFKANPTEADPEQIRQAVQEAIVSQCEVDEDDVTVVVTTAAANWANDPLDLSVTISSSWSSQLDWVVKFAKAASEAKKKTLRRVQNAVFDPDKYTVIALSPMTNNVVSTITMEFPVHGVDYSDLHSGGKRSFLKEFAEGVRQGFNYDQPGFPGKKYGDIQNVLDDIQVVVSSNEPVGSVRVRVEIPAPPTPPAARQLGLMSRLEKDSDTLLKTHLQDELRKVDGINLISTWTNGNIHVTMPGHNL